MNAYSKIFFTLLTLMLLSSCVSNHSNSNATPLITLTSESPPENPHQTLTPRRLVEINTPSPEITRVESTETAHLTPTPSWDDLHEYLDNIRISNTREIIYLFSMDTVLYGAVSIGDDQFLSSNIIAVGTDHLPPSDELQFANYAPLVAYIDGNSNLWIADLAMKIPVRIDTLADRELYRLVWSPDDRYLLISADLSTMYMLDIVSGEFLPWHYLCTILGISTRSQNVSVWCPSIESDTDYAVLEWGGEIWYTDQAPSVILLQQTPDTILEAPLGMLPLYQNVGWSSDGKKIAYYDTYDPQGALIIINQSGEHLAVYPGKAYWISPLGKAQQKYVDFALRWSENQDTLVVYAIGDQEQPCPNITIEFGILSGDYINPPCWQVLDPQDGRLIWGVNDLIEIQSLVPGQESLNFYYPPELSSDSKYLVIWSFTPADKRLYIIELESNILISSIRLPITDYRWGPVP
jgi:hypothetical protein